MKVLFLSLFIVVTDQLSKFLVKGGTIPLLNFHVKGMDYGSSVNVFGNFFKLTFVENPGIAFGIDIDGTSKLLLSIFSILASIGIFYYLWKSREQKLIVRISLAFILGGALGNLIDRAFYGLFYGYAPLFYGKVVDFFNMEFFDFTLFGRTFERFPIFNVADSAVTVGVVLLLLFYRSPKEEKVVETSEVVLKSADNVVDIKNSVIDLNDSTSVLIEADKSDVKNNNREEI